MVSEPQKFSTSWKSERDDNNVSFLMITQKLFIAQTLHIKNKISD